MTFLQIVAGPAEINNLGGEVNTVMLWAVKWSLIILSFFYVLMSIIIVRQIRIMRQTVITSFSPTLRLIGLLHLLLAVVVFITFLIIL